MNKSLYRINEFAEKNPDKIAIIDGDIKITFKQLLLDAIGLSKKIPEIKRGNTVLANLPTCYEFYVAWMASVIKGLVFIPCNQKFTGPEIVDIYDFIEPSLCFLNKQEHIDAVSDADSSIPIIRIEGTYDKDTSFFRMMRNEERDISLPNDFDAKAVSIVIMTSGSTGKPKGVMHSVYSLMNSTRGIANCFHTTEDDVIYLPVPLPSMYGIGGSVLAFGMGGSIVLHRKFEPEEALNLIEKHKITIQFAVPTHYIRQMQAYEAMNTKPDISSLKSGMIGSAPSTRYIFEWFEEKAGCRLLNAYGQTETNSQVMVDLYDMAEKRYTTSGKRTLGVELKIVDNNGEVCPHGEPGEIWAKTPGMMLGYFKQPELTAETITEDGWVKTGDMGIEDEEGYITIVGRKKDMIIRGGNNIYPAEIEDIYSKHRNVVVSAAVAYPDSDLGEKTALFLELNDEAAFDAEEMKNYAKGKLCSFKIPDIIIPIKTMPLSPNGKIDKRVLRTMVKDYVDCSRRSRMN